MGTTTTTAKSGATIENVASIRLACEVCGFSCRRVFHE
jgi:hypothetical protein